MTDQESAPLFIVDNAPEGRSGLGYLREWTELASRFDIATGYFDIGALLALDGGWQKLEGMRILMGDEVSASTRRALLQAVRTKAEAALDASIEEAKAEDPFLEGAPGIVGGLNDGRIECRVYNRDKFHAKAYITHGRFDVVGSQALVGSSNFTRPGLTQNIELNIKIESGPEVSQLQRWFERHWDEAVPVDEDVLRTIERHTAEYTPFEAYAKALQSLTAAHDPSGLVWERHESRVYPKLDRYQQEAYEALMDIARQHGGAFLCDGVGLGKTFVGLMLIERLVMHEKKRVVLFAPKAVRESVWERELKRHLDHIGGYGGTADFSNLTVFSHTDLSRGGEFPDRLTRVAELADTVIIDEAHHFRNRGRRRDPEDPSTWSRYHRLAELIGSGQTKQVYHLTATPINNSLNDFRHMVALFTGGNDAAFAQTLGVASVNARLKNLTQKIRQQTGQDIDPPDAPEVMQDVLADDQLFRGLVVQRSRAYARESQVLEKGEATLFPERKDPRVVPYSLKGEHGELLGTLDESFQREKPLFSLAIYYPLAYYTGQDTEIDPFEENRQQQVVGLIRTNFLKRFESSVFAFERSCDRLMRKLLAFLTKHAVADADRRLYERWLLQHEGLLDFVAHRQLDLLGEAPSDDEEDADDLVPPELLEAFEDLDPGDYNISAICAECILDLDQIARLLEQSRQLAPSDDDKLQALIKLLQGEEAGGRKALVFTEFADTARYLRTQLVEAGIGGVAEIDGSSKVDRAAVVESFAPYYNGVDSASLAEAARDEIDVLVATDVLAEGLNLQDATQIVNYDIHWNPVKLMQRIGRVDRRLDPEVEQRLVADHPEREAERGRVALYNFLPPDELDTLLRLYQRVSFKTLLISKTLGIEGRRFLAPDDEYAALREFNSAYEGEASADERLHLEYQELVAASPGLEEKLDALPGGVFSGRGESEEATFFCYELPALDVEQGRYTLEAGTTRWYLQRPDASIEENPEPIASVVRSAPDTPRAVAAGRDDLRATKAAVDKHIKDTYLRDLDVPLDAPKPQLVVWMAVSG